MRFHIGFRCRFERVVNLHLKLEDINRALQIRIDIAGRIAVSCVALRSLFPFAGREGRDEHQAGQKHCHPLFHLLHVKNPPFVMIFSVEKRQRTSLLCGDKALFKQNFYRPAAFTIAERISRQYYP